MVNFILSATSMESDDPSYRGSYDASHPSENGRASEPLVDVIKTREYAEERWSTWSDPHLGNLTLTSKWFDLIFRPTNLEPWPRNKIKTKFSLHTRKVPHTNATLKTWTYLFANDTKTISGSSFSASRPTKFVTNGFMSTGYEDYIQDIVAGLLIDGDYNVIVTHWGPGSGKSGLDYSQGIANIRVVGLEIAYLVNTLVKKFGVKAADVHLIGHSLGSHASGYAGQNIPNLGRITALDPAGPSFTNMDPIVRLDPSDAKFVDNFHTAGGLLGTGMLGGTMQPMGHLDYYVNGGISQPGCSLFDNIVVFGACSHLRSVRLYGYYLKSTCQAVAYECRDYNSFLQGNCYSCGKDNSRCAPVGMKAILYPNKTRTNVKLYYTTTEKSPFCQYQYAIQTTVADKKSPASANVYGMVSVSVNGNAKASLVPLQTKATFSQGKSTNLSMTSLLDFGKITNVTLVWKPTADLGNWLYCLFNNCNLYVANVTISLMNNYPEAKRLANTFTACPASGSKYATIQANGSAIFNVGSCK